MLLAQQARAPILFEQGTGRVEGTDVVFRSTCNSFLKLLVHNRLKSSQSGELRRMVEVGIEIPVSPQLSKRVIRPDLDDRTIWR